MIENGSTTSADGATSSPPRRYRALLIGLAGDILRRRTVLAGSDGEALAVAGSMVDGRTIELWDGHRLVGRLDRGRT